MPLLLQHSHVRPSSKLMCFGITYKPLSGSQKTLIPTSMPLFSHAVEAAILLNLFHYHPQLLWCRPSSKWKNEWSICERLAESTSKVYKTCSKQEAAKQSESIIMLEQWNYKDLISTFNMNTLFSWLNVVVKRGFNWFGQSLLLFLQMQNHFMEMTHYLLLKIFQI